MEATFCYYFKIKRKLEGEVERSMVSFTEKGYSYHLIASELKTSQLVVIRVQKRRIASRSTFNRFGSSNYNVQYKKGYVSNAFWGLFSKILVESMPNRKESFIKL